MLCTNEITPVNIPFKDCKSKKRMTEAQYWNVRNLKIPHLNLFLTITRIGFRLVVVIIERAIQFIFHLFIR
ncbi:hypothetical protein ABE23_18040 [Bacillus thuringiensis]|uniref:Uncharacterized protein n=1 Tax=Bacillus thuringiensis TaxID=1428 RepID=A0A1W6WY23_BACTU|nr:hypothetical protein CAB88_30920 [Bacillus thuringiensis]MBG9622671.1 hypothetical protein [Bacillus thuringiensis]MBG9661535.1 hypothetical protein [Bacillus thuringiensis]OTW37629.1 hypothetical protein BK698_31305 [Bacillus thuringiensis serovar thuringiensis]